LILAGWLRSYYQSIIRYRLHGDFMNNREWTRIVSCICIALSFLTVSNCSRVTVNKNNFVSYRGSMLHKGRVRTYLMHIPPSYHKESLTPLVIALHGGGGDGNRMEKFTLMSHQSDTGGFLLVYPDAIEGHWNDGRGVHKYRSHRKDIDDIGFISALIDVLAENYNVDMKRIYVTGSSNGGLMSNRLACELTDRITAIAPVIGSIAENIAARCLPKRPIPVLMINGTDDQIVPWEGEYVRSGHKKLGKILSIPDTVNFWVSHNGCLPMPEITWEPDINPEDGTRVRTIVYGKCKDGVKVVLYEIQGGGHTWPRGPRHLPEFIFGKTSRDIDANQIIWRFFKQFRR